MTMAQSRPALDLAIKDVVARVNTRPIEGNSAILLPFDEDGNISYTELAAHIERTAAAGLRPCVNMDTGYVNLLSLDERLRVLETTREVMGGRSFIAGAFIEGLDGDPEELYLREVATIQRFGGVPIIFQSSYLTGLSEEGLLAAYRRIASQCDQVIAFELGKMFAPFGAIYSLDVVRGLMEIPQITGMKHSSLDREQEWTRLRLRDAVRPDFKVYTGNDLAIDMVMYGSDYLLGLSTFAPEKFAERDRLWAAGDPAFYQLNDLLQYLGFLAFRPPTPGYKHNAAQFLTICGLISSDRTHPLSPVRPASDVAILRDIAERLGLL
ncbi:MAG TPA: dihydrodipicolinate synthase family protein [Ktedonosporobacter sp.]|nr:dihydrodipicolinate synthase family protein [Ktedonosporobacter sp.]